MDRRFWAGKRVFLTGHTGFKGGWLSTWLIDAGATVAGYALAPETKPSFFETCGLEGRIESINGDVRDASWLEHAVKEFEPEVVFHLAAQPLVRRSYDEPVETFETNVLGTVNLLQAVRGTPSVRAVVNVTTDKCYENREQARGYAESDPMGGHDPYSASKACSELATRAYERSFFSKAEPPVGIATARAGNVFGGGDWAADRIVPDAMRAFTQRVPLVVRNPASVRPFQHVLEPLDGYLLLAERLYAEPRRFSGAWNLGPDEKDAAPVSAVADLLVKAWGEASWLEAPRDPAAPHEAKLLSLDSSKAKRELGWRPRLSIEDAVGLTVEWHKNLLKAADKGCWELTCEQIQRYEALKEARLTA